MSRVTEQYQRACDYLAGGVRASTRLNRAVGHAMLFDRAEGCRVWDLDGKEYIDLCCSHGATLLGHGDAARPPGRRGGPGPRRRLLLRERAARRAGRLLCETVPCLRARPLHRLAAPRRRCTACAWPAPSPAGPKILKFEGNFHGYHDQVMFAIGTPADRLGPEDGPTAYPGSTGLPRGPGPSNLVLVPYNRPDLLEEAFRRHAHELAAVICEPVYYNAGCILPTPEFLDALRRLTHASTACC